ncbi:hypothetical protein AALC17_02960 [Oscillospiraceae bacterium 38-13]
MGNDLLTGFLAGQSDGNGNNNGGGFFGNEGLWAVIILAIIFGWGNGNGPGGRGNNSGGDNVTVVPYPAPGYGMGFGGALTRADLCQEMNDSQMLSGIRSLANGLCDSTFALTTGMNNGFAQAELARCNQQALLMQQLFQMGSQNQACCCETQRLIERASCDAAYAAATNTTAIIQNAHNDTDRVLAKLDAMEMARKDETIAELRAALQTANFRESQASQNAVLEAKIDASVAELLRRSGCDCGGSRCC